MTHATRDDDGGASSADVAAMLSPTSSALGSMHRAQVHRDPWPRWPEHVDHLPRKLRRDAALQWAGRARNEYRSVHQFSALLRAATRSRLPLHILGALARLVTDEVRHAEVCARMAMVCFAEGRAEEPALFRWPEPTTGWDPEPDDEAQRRVWMAHATLEACCFGETLSVPMLKAISTVATEPSARAAADQILRDEHLHAKFGWETLAYLLEGMSDDGRAALQAGLPPLFRGFERSCCQHVTLEEVAQAPTVTVRPGRDDEPNLGTLTPHEYAVIFYATVESELMPGLIRLGFDAAAAWTGRQQP